MHPVVSLVFEHGYTHRHLAAPVLFSLFATIAHVHEPVQHSLLITAVSWAVIWLATVIKAGLWSSTRTKRRRTSWLAGAFLGFALICDRAACDKKGIWASKVNIKLIILVARY
jgi:hypothetical protein